MVDFNNISADLRGRIEKIMAGDGNDSKRIDSRNEYNQLAELLSGKGKTSGTEKGFVENLMTDYEEEFMVSKNVKDRVLEIIKFREPNKADDNAELKELKDFKKTNGLTKEEKNWIQKVIEGRVVKVEQPHSTDKNIIEHGEQPIPPNANVNFSPIEPKENHNFGKEPVDSELLPNEPNPYTAPKDKERIPDKTEPKKEQNPVNPPTDTAPKEPKKPEHKAKPTEPMPTKPEPTVPKDSVPDIVPEEPVTETPPTTTEVPLPKGNKELSPTEIKHARFLGEVIANKLFEYTTNTEQKTVQDILEKELNSDNVIEILRGYEEKLAEDSKLTIVDKVVAVGVNPIPSIVKKNKDSFFEQMRTEWDFPEKEELMRKVANDLQTYLTNKYGADSKVAKEVAVILLERTLEQRETEKLDKIVKTEFEK